MSKTNQHSRNKAGLPPGSVIFTGDKMVDKVIMHYMQYDAQSLKEIELDTHQKITLQPSEDHLVDWYDIRGVHDTKFIEQIGKMFEIHPLIQEDIADTHNRPKYDEYPTGNFIILKALAFDAVNNQIVTEQVGIYFRKGLVVTFQETESDLFQSVRSRISSGKGRIKARGSDYLSYALMDAVVDNYFVVMDNLEDTIEIIEDTLLNKPTSQIKERVHFLKKELLKMRKSVAPLREAISRFSKSESPLIEDSSLVFTRDLYDHTIQIMDMVDNYRDTLNGLQDLYLSEISFRMNQVMQVLTIITTIFVPLSFLAGLYGMNFDNIPELHNPYGYFILLGVMFMIFIGSLYYFKRKGWF